LTVAAARRDLDADAIAKFIDAYRRIDAPTVCPAG
jgi:hypothetical protein